ncbi:MAG: hypothetical protein NVS3B20_15810 [Polyangiales bacterium]
MNQPKNDNEAKHVGIEADRNDAEQRILSLLGERMREGRRSYGPWNLHDGRRYPREALSEVLDALHYCAAELLRLDDEAPRPDAPADVLIEEKACDAEVDGEPC